MPLSFFSPIKILVNAIPLVNANTGISRYIKCLYENISKNYGSKYSVTYFDGSRILSVPPQGPSNFTRWSQLVNFIWLLPPYCALLFRLCLHYSRELAFKKIAQNYNLYHETAFFPFAVPSKTHTVFTIYDLSLLRYPDFHPKERVLYNRLFFKARVSIADRFLCISEFTKNEIITLLGVPAQKITVTPLAHDRNIFYPRTAGEIYSVLKRHGLPKKFFLFVGTGDPRKNFEVIPKALKAANLSVPLVVVGWSGWLKKKAVYDNVLYLGYVSDDELACLYSTAQAFVFPSIYEGFGLPVLEAMACGCPVVTTKCASLPEAGGDAAIYLEDPYNYEELADILAGFVESKFKRPEIIEKSLAHAKKFSWDMTAQKTIAVFDYLTNT